MKKKTIIIILIAVVIAAVIVFIVGGKSSSKINFQFVKIERGDIESTVSCTGTLQFLNQQNVVALVAGNIDKLYVDFNQKVRKGQKLASIDSITYKLAYDSAKANLDKAIVQRDQNQTDYDNTKALFDQHFKAQTDLDTAKLNLVTGQVGVQTAQIQLDQARVNLEWATLLSPLNGIVVQRNVDVGDAVAVGNTTTPPFIVASDIAHMQILASVDENDISQVKVGEEAKFTVQAYNDRKFTGKVSQIRLQPQIVQNVVNYTVVIDVVNKDNMLMPGMTATVDIVASKEAQVLKVANAALKFRPTPEIFKAMGFSMTNRRGGSWGQGSGGNGGGGFGGGLGGGGNTNRRADFGLLWTQDTNSGKLRAMPVKIGATDGQFTELKSTNVQEDMPVITGVLTAAQNKVAQQKNPFQQSMGGGGRGPGGR